MHNVPDDADGSAVSEAEFNTICHEVCPGLRKLRAKLKHQNYAFEKPLPGGAILKIACGSVGQHPLLTFSEKAFTHASGLAVSILERVLLTLQIMALLGCASSEYVILHICVA